MSVGRVETRPGTDPITAHEAAASVDRANARVAHNAARKSPEAKAKRNKGRIQKQRGYAFEVWVAQQLGGTRVPLSGSLGGELRGDVRLPDGRRGECKRRAHMKTLHAWLEQGGADFLALGTVGDAVLVFRLDKAAIQMIGGLVT